ncbi:vomeronasal type-1 receptor 90-like [Marmota marmota marmota]|uniref:vomeronasal type-1 receptor 90-like n=1 Tax=Marmota marmota marmota TaxID=9994 RepID=UPI000762BC69|nr:vomeronasal type-1 receptor 90-like [Marmota marmota marmota]
MTKSSTLHIFVAVGNVFSSQITLGITANVFLLLFHVLTCLLQRRIRTTDFIIAHLALIHLLMLIIRVFLDIDILGVRDIWNDITCKAVIYLYRLMRSLSVSTTCLLSVLQATTLSPRSCFLAKFKHTSPQHSLRYFLILWVFNMFINIRILVSTEGPTNDTLDVWFSTESCRVSPTGYYYRILFSLVGILRDIFLLGLMALSSGYMVALLWRHKRQCQHLHSTSRIPQASPEQRATRTILLLMASIVVMYFVDCVISSCSGKMQKKDPVRLVFQMLVGNGYATVSALMLICTEKRIIQFFQSTLGRMRTCLRRAR